MGKLKNGENRLKMVAHGQNFQYFVLMPQALVEIPQFLAGVNHLLTDNTNGKRNLTWLSQKVNIPRTTLDRKLRTGRIWMGEVFAISDALGSDFLHIMEVGASVISNEEVAA